MRYADFLARITGLCVAVAGTALVGREFLVGIPGGIREVAVAAPGSLSAPGVATVGIGAAFVAAGLAVLAGRWRWVAVSVGGVAAVVAVASLAVGIGSSAAVVGVGVAGLALLFAGAASGGPAVG
ncbi:hypothetical protein GCM10008995_22770 [Halobellus salinus]|uniref:Uncharacterized protein n=1 Tax=Halobellus salinus TaxID=931585 RepID=A0A830ECF8_9EURY|nr:hypothetical protein [Halobellus salinus]GGJ12338.1 hypothetical protein GCM10008995_22770 [Halobellus salinus]SMP29080.1 hypothetical protein SAMN06265347_11453 [Halobellus salinus]